MKTGVPQGSILGPKLFILYINDIYNVSDILKFILFTDDTNIFCSGKDIGKLCETVNTELKKLLSWFIVNRLSLHIAKTNYMLFGRQKINTKVNFQLNNIDIERVYVTKFLGVLIDHELNLKEHIKLVRSKLSKIIAKIYRASMIFEANALFTLYCALFLPYLSYCCEVWGNTCKSNIEPIYLLQSFIYCKFKE